ncbi:DUF6082 family protein [Streptomyces pseudovenezuelae]|uniref:DUF6082 family protein n=1 Tax=Streptomyces pseudovenezuelae TaxID=67350 RepID=UPI0036E9E6A9
MDELAGSVQGERLAKEIARANMIRFHRIALENLDRAIDDPSLAMAMSTLEGLSENKRRQVLFANRQYATLLLGYRIGALNRSELLDALRILSRNQVFAEYWKLTGPHRRSMTSVSLERRVGKAVDAVMEEPEGELEEWWVVGPGSSND